jgi:3-methyladenine DNA glycosylase Mpg
MITGQINVCKHIFCSFTVRDPKAPVSAPKTKRIGITTAIDYCFELAVRELLGLMSHI